MESKMKFESTLSVCMKKWLQIIVLFVVLPSMWSLPVNVSGDGVGLKKTCGRALVARVDRICQNRGGHMTYTNSRRIRRGIVNECCTNKCADQHLYAYCSNYIQDNGSNKSIVPSLSENDIFEVAESRLPEVQQFYRIITSQSNKEIVTHPSIVTDSTLRYPDVLVKGNVDSTIVDRIMKTLPRNSNDYQIGTVPPEYLTSHYIPSRARITRYY